MVPSHSKSYTRAEWLQKTPYAGSTAKESEAAINKLLEKYGVVTRQWTDHVGPNGRPAVTVRFNLDGLTYRMGVEALDVRRAEPSELRRQSLRVIYWTLKPLLEAALMFGGYDRLLLPFAEADDRMTVYERMAPFISGGRLAARDLLGEARRLALPAPQPEGPIRGEKDSEAVGENENEEDHTATAAKEAGL